MTSVEGEMTSMEYVEKGCPAPPVTIVLVVHTTPSPATMTWTASPGRMGGLGWRQSLSLHEGSESHRDYRDFAV